MIIINKYFIIDLKIDSERSYRHTHTHTVTHRQAHTHTRIKFVGVYSLQTVTIYYSKGLYYVTNWVLGKWPGKRSVNVLLLDLAVSEECV